MTLITYTCEGCGKTDTYESTGRGRRRKWCSERCRKNSYSMPCQRCGAPMTGCNGRGPNAPVTCKSCAASISADPGVRRELWAGRVGAVTFTDDDLVDAVTRATDHLGHVPTCNEYRALGWAPSYATITQRIGWNEALTRAGLPTRTAHRQRGVPTLPDEYLIGQLREFATLDPACRERVYATWARDNGRPSSACLRLRFGGWFGALDAAGIEPLAVAA